MRLNYERGRGFSSISLRLHLAMALELATQSLFRGHPHEMGRIPTNANVIANAQCRRTLIRFKNETVVPKLFVFAFLQRCAERSAAVQPV